MLLALIDVSRGISMRCICWAWCLDRKQLADAVGYLTRATRERPRARVNYHLGTALLS